ncbi:hypothetical protein [Sinorhizobium psoraleae]|uniref:hypothetical protein n=1 Tax=Sinorhizobium psoraleae TaxID=520838 RepID=UPI00289A0C00|nr:hypothetical protein [Sinorhizobium psoraleae]
MFRITLQKMLILIRLAIVASLAGYSVPTASAAMHGAWPDLEVSQSVHQHHEVATGDHLHGDHDQSSLTTSRSWRDRLLSGLLRQHGHCD